MVWKIKARLEATTKSVVKVATVSGAIFLIFWMGVVLTPHTTTPADVLPSVGVIYATHQILDPSPSFIEINVPDKKSAKGKKPSDDTWKIPTIPEVKGICTGTLIDKIGGGYLVLTAAHCLTEDHSPYSIRFSTGNRGPYPLQFLAKGDPHQGRDFALFLLPTNEKRPVIHVGDYSKTRVGDSVGYAGWADGLGLQWFVGDLSHVAGFSDPQQTLLNENFSWQTEMSAQIPSGEGASGSALIDLRRGTVIGVLSGYITDIGGVTFFAPVSQSDIQELIFDAAH